jgi:hypothetical protein
MKLCEITAQQCRLMASPRSDTLQRYGSMLCKG